MSDNKHSYYHEPVRGEQKEGVLCEKEAEKELLDRQTNLLYQTVPSSRGDNGKGTGKEPKGSAFSLSCCSCSLFRRCSRASIGKHALGVVLILCVNVIWVASSVWIQYIFGELEYAKPYFMTYFNTTCFALWNFGYLLLPSWRRVPWKNEIGTEHIIFTDPILKAAYERGELFSTTAEKGNTKEQNNTTDGVNPSTKEYNEAMTAEVHITNMASTEKDDAEESLTHKPDKKYEAVRPYSKFRIFRCACFFCPCWFLANYLFNISLSRTSVASNTVLSSTSSIWTLLLSVLLFGQRVDVIKLSAVALCVGGAAMVGFADGMSALANESVSGDLLALFSAFFYAIYISVLKFMLPDDERQSMAMVFGAVGIVNLFVFWPGLPFLDAISFESFQLPTVHQLWPLIINTLIGTNLSDVLWARSVVLTSPIIATLGLTLTTPMSMVVDIIIKGKKFPPLYVVGAVCVMSGFILINMEINLTQKCMRRISIGR